MYAWCPCPRASADYLQMQQNEIRLCLENYSAKQLLAQLNGSKVFTHKVPGQVFWQILPAPESWACATSLTSFGGYYFNIPLFGKSSRPEYFQRQMSSFSDGLEGVICHVDRRGWQYMITEWSEALRRIQQHERRIQIKQSFTDLTRNQLLLRLFKGLRWEQLMEVRKQL